MVSVIRSVEEASTRLEATVAEGARRIVGIVGGPGSGKSTAAEAIAAALGERCALLPMDGYHLPNALLDQLGRRRRKGAPDTFDVHALAADLERIARGERVRAPRFDRTIDGSVDAAIEIPAGAPIVLVEGNYLLLDGDWDAVARSLDEAWYLDTEDDLRHRRVVERHMRFGRSAEDAESWARQVDAPNAALIASTRMRADALLRFDDPRAAARTDAGPAGGGGRR